jgi:FKBP-type peptidyl-prolyl cis-trans isomerase
MKRLALILIACLSLAGAGCGGGDDDSSSTTAAEATTTEATTTESSPAPKKLEPATTKSGEKKTEPKVTVPKGVSPSRLATRDIETGTGAGAKKGDRLTVQYVGVGYDSEVEFESTWEDQPYSFTLGDGEVIPGWEQGLEGMKAGGRRELIVPSKLAYGAEGVVPAIGPNETVMYVIDLLAVE